MKGRQRVTGEVVRRLLSSSSCTPSALHPSQPAAKGCAMGTLQGQAGVNCFPVPVLSQLDLSLSLNRKRVGLSL